MNRQKIKITANDVQLVPNRGKVGDLRSLTSYYDNSDGELLPPAVARDRDSSKYVIIGGERRWRAALRASSAQPLYVIVCTFWGDYLSWMTLDKLREDPAYPSMPMPVTDVVTLTESLRRYLSPGRDDHMDDTVGEYFEMSAGRIGEARSLKKIKDRHNNPADIQRLVDDEWANVASGTAAPSAAFQRVRKAEVLKITPPGDARVQRSKLTGSAQVCAGLVDALDNFGIVSPELTDEELAQAIKALGDGRRGLDVLVRKLQTAVQERRTGS